MSPTQARRARRLSAGAFTVAALATLGYWAAPPGLLTRTIPTFVGLVATTLLFLVAAVTVWGATAVAERT